MIDFRRGWDESVKFFLQTPYLGEEPNQLSEHTTIRTIELSIVNDDSALAHDFVDETVNFFFVQNFFNFFLTFAI